MSLKLSVLMPRLAFPVLILTCVFASAVMSELNVAMCFHDVLASVCYVDNYCSHLPMLFVYNGAVNLVFLMVLLHLWR